jgi:hypothetical protein
MATTLKEMQFELLPSEHADEGEGFGLGLDVEVDEDGFHPGATEWGDQDQDNATRGGVGFGRDVLTGPTWAWDLFVDQADVPSAKAATNRFATAWRALHIRDKPGAVIPLRFRVGDDVRRIYGRPRGFDAPPNNRILSGFVPIQCDFKAVDGFVYADVEDTLTLGLQQGSEGGFVFPVVFPVRTLPVGTQRAQAVVGGDAPTYPVVRFTGPVANPTLITPDWTLRLDYSIPANQYVEIDLRPWRLTVMLNGTSSVAGKLAPRTRLSDLALEPGRYDMTYRGSSSTGASTCQVRWAAAFNSY